MDVHIAVDLNGAYLRVFEDRKEAEEHAARFGGRVETRTVTPPKMQFPKQFDLPEGIQVKLSENASGKITSELPTEKMSIKDVVESIILGHACAGVNIASQSYIQGLTTAFDAIDNH